MLNVHGFKTLLILVVANVLVDCEVLVVSGDFVNLEAIVMDLYAQSLEGAHMTRLRVCF